MKSFDILKVSERARSSKLDLPLYNATAGMFFSDDGNLLSFSSVRHSLEKISSTTNFSYPPSLGNKLFLDSLKSFIFSFDEKLKDDFDIVLTLGGTGALSMVASYVKSKNIILPRLLWTNYYAIFDVAKDEASYYELFSIDSLKECLKEADTKDGQPILVINDPAQNPTGYSMNEKEYEELVEAINDYAKDKKITLILDVAYNDYGEDSSRPYRFAKCFNENVSLFYAFSASKTFGIYSLRTGALLFKKNADLLSTFNHIARATYSCPPTLGNEIIHQINSDEKVLKQFKEELEVSRILLKKRGEIACRVLDELHIDHLPYHFGFYISIYLEKNTYEICEKLEQRNCFFVPMDEHHIRVALCSLPTNKVEGALRLLKEVIDEK